jgi:hypothetical protein
MATRKKYTREFKQDEGTIRLHLVPGEAEEGMFGLEVADLQDAIDLRADRYGRGPEPVLLLTGTDTSGAVPRQNRADRRERIA